MGWGRTDFESLAEQVGVGAVSRGTDAPWSVLIKLPKLEMDLVPADARRLAKVLIEYALFAEGKNPKPKKAKAVKKVVKKKRG